MHGQQTMATFSSFLLPTDAAHSKLQNRPRMSFVQCMDKKLWPLFPHFPCQRMQLILGFETGQEWAPYNARAKNYGHFFLVLAANECSSFSASKQAKNVLSMIHVQKPMTTFSSFLLPTDAAHSRLRSRPRMSVLQCMGKEVQQFLTFSVVLSPDGREHIIFSVHCRWCWVGSPCSDSHS